MALRSIPDDFAANAKTMTGASLRQHYQCGQNTLTRWLRECGKSAVVGNPHEKKHLQRPMPDDFEDYANTESLSALAKRYKAGINAVVRWKRQVGAQILKNPLRAMPDTFPQTAVAYCRHELLTMYQCGSPVLERWLAEVGVAPKKYVPTNRRTGKTWIGRATGTVIQTPTPARDDSVAGEAADFLRRKGWVVFKARTIRNSAGKDDWIVGRLTLPTREMIDKAARGGFQRREMM